MEFEIARDEKIKVFTFICHEDFHRYLDCDEEGNSLPEEELEKQKLQVEHRDRLKKQREDFTVVRNEEELLRKISQLRPVLDQTQSKEEKRSKFIVTLLTVLFVSMGFIGILTYLANNKLTEIESSQASLEQIGTNPKTLGDRLRQTIEEAARLKIQEAAGDWRKVQEVERHRDIQLTKVEDTIRTIHEGLEQGANKIFAHASKMLVEEERELPEVLEYLVAQRPRLLKEAADLNTLEAEIIARKRKTLRPLFLEAALLTQEFEWDAALDRLSTVVEQAPNWWEAHNRYGRLLEDRALWERSEVVLRKSLALAQTDLERATSLNNLALLFESTGRLDAAEPLIREALDIREKTSGPDHPETLVVINNFALILTEQGAYVEAEALYRQAVEASTDANGNYNADAFTYLNNLAHLLIDKGEFRESEDILRMLFEVCDHRLGRKHPKTLLAMGNFANVLRLRGAHQRAAELGEEAVQISELIHGRNHPSTLRHQNNLALLLGASGRDQEAEILYRKVIEGRTQLLGREHPDTLTVLSNLGVHLIPTRPEESTRLLEEVLEVRRRELGSSHPTTLQACLNRIATFDSTSLTDSVRELSYREVIEISQDTLGREHPTTLAAKMLLADSLELREDFEGAEKLLMEVLEIRERKYGFEHQSTTRAISRLAKLLYKMGVYTDSENLFREVVEVRERMLGLEHVETLSSINSLANLLADQGKTEEAIDLFRRAVNGSEKLLGVDHASTRLYQENLNAVLGKPNDLIDSQ